MKKLFVYLLFVSVFCQYSCGSTAVAGSQEGQEKLANGMTIETYKIKKTVDFPTQKSSCTNSEFDYEVDWPIDGPKPLLKKAQEWILQQLDPDENFSNRDLSNISIESILNERIIINSPNYDKDYDWYFGVVTDDIKISIQADESKTTISSSINNVGCGQNSLGFKENKLIMLNSGEEMAYSMFPPIEKMRPFIWSHLLNWDEPVENAQYGDYRNIDYPHQLPAIIDDNFVFQWPVSRFENLTATIPISEVYPILSAQLRKFLPAK